MPRNPPAASTLRNRNRITNKSRLKLHRGSLDTDLLLFPDEDEEKLILNNLVAGVDAEDANVTILPTTFLPRHPSFGGCATRGFYYKFADKSLLSRNTTCRRFSLQPIGIRQTKESPVESHLPLHSQPLFLPQILLESLITIMNYIYPINGRTQRAMQSRLRLLKRALLMD